MRWRWPPERLVIDHANSQLNVRNRRNEMRSPRFPLMSYTHRPAPISRAYWLAPWVGGCRTGRNPGVRLTAVESGGRAVLSGCSIGVGRLTMAPPVGGFADSTALPLPRAAGRTQDCAGPSVFVTSAAGWRPGIHKQEGQREHLKRHPSRECRRDGEPSNQFRTRQHRLCWVLEQRLAGGRDLGGRVVVGFKLSSRDAVDAVYEDLTGAGYTGLQARPMTPSGAQDMRGGRRSGRDCCWPYEPPLCGASLGAT